MNHTNQPRHLPAQPSASKRLGPSIAHLATTLLMSLALLFPTLTYAAGPLPAPSEAQQDDVLAGVDRFSQGAKESSEVTLDKSMMGMASSILLMQGGGHGGMDLALMSIMQKMDSVLVRNYEYAAPGQYKMEDVEQVRKRLDSPGWSHIAKTHSATGTSDICIKRDSEGVISDVVIIDAEPKELNFIHLRGHMSPHDLSQLSGGLGGMGDLMLKQRPK